MNQQFLRYRLGLNVPYEWWPAAPLLKGFEAAGAAWVQIPSPPASVLSNPRHCLAHGRATATTLETTALRAMLHAPGSLLVGEPGADHIFEGLLAYAAECGAEQIVYHAHNVTEGPGTEDRLLAETRSLARLAVRAERLSTAIAVENLAPLFPGPETISHTPKTLRTLVRRISSPAVGLCLDVGHANVVAELRRTDIMDLIGPVLDAVTVFHVHDNLGARRTPEAPAELDPLRLDLHLPPGRGTLPWPKLAAALRAHTAPLMLEVHPPHRGGPASLLAAARQALGDTPQRVPAAA